jgi:hypothetical protein
MQIIEIIGDVAQAKHELAALNIEPIVLQRCTTRLTDLTKILEQLLTLVDSGFRKLWRG